ncbi:DUF1641 domain-containing protein [Paenibacillus turpanensis]|uniref:DUF1641 domain-containing protein n=1 Tax=Paenibacillus turpanensis TaxID=2689078 RepID=UPI00140DDC3E|nr:DUF1641 domain-containing protein [Paenibacillus turpanensis]
MNATETNQSALTEVNQADKQELSHLLAELAKPEVQQSLTLLLTNLPQLTEAATKLADAYQFVNTLATDPVFVEDVKGGFNEMVMPVVEGAKGVASAAIEAKDRAETQSDTIGVFGLLKMMKDPQAQKMFRFMREFLAIQNERQSNR